MARKVIDRNTEVVITNNIYASFNYSDRGIHFELSEFGDEDYLTFGELKTLSTSKSKRVLQNMHILVTEVLTEEDIELEDVLEQLKLDKHYKIVRDLFGVEEVTTDSFKDFLKESSAKEIKEVFKKHGFLKSILSETAVELYKKSDIDAGVMEEILTGLGIKDVYSFLDDIRASQKPIEAQ